MTTVKNIEILGKKIELLVAPNVGEGTKPNWNLYVNRENYKSINMSEFIKNNNWYWSVIIADLKDGAYKLFMPNQATKEILDYLKTHSKGDTYLYNNRLFMDGFISKSEYDYNHSYLSNL